MGKKSKKTKEVEIAMPRQIKKDIFDIARYLAEKCRKPTGSDYDDFVDIFKNVEIIRKKQQAYVRKHPDRSKHMDELIKWMKTNGVDTDKVGVASFGKLGFGLKAAKDLKEEEVFLTVPRRLTMSAKSFLETELGKYLGLGNLSTNLALGLHLLAESLTPNSFWAPYIKTLPSSYSTILYFTPEEISRLKGSRALHEAVSLYRTVVGEYSLFFIKLEMLPDKSVMLPIRNFCFDDFRWAISTVMTRQNHIPVSSGVQESVLIPLWDLCNHGSGRMLTNYSLEENACVSQAMTDVKAGEEIKIFYGPRSNLLLMLHNGFVHTDSRFDEFTLLLGVSKGDQLYALKSEALDRLNLIAPINFKLTDSEVPITRDCHAFLRIFVMDEDNLKSYLSDKSTGGRLESLRQRTSWVSVGHEIKAWDILEKRCQIMMSRYSTKLEQDEAALNDARLRSQMSENAQMAVLYVAGEKRILERAINFCCSRKAHLIGRMTVAMVSNPQTRRRIRTRLIESKSLVWSEKIKILGDCFKMLKMRIKLEAEAEGALPGLAGSEKSLNDESDPKPASDYVEDYVGDEEDPDFYDCHDDRVRSYDESLSPYQDEFLMDVRKLGYEIVDEEPVETKPEDVPGVNDGTSGGVVEIIDKSLQECSIRGSSSTIDSAQSEQLSTGQMKYETNPDDSTKSLTGDSVANHANGVSNMKE